MLGSIWLTTDNKEIEKIIFELSKKEKTIPFKPHITVVNGIKSTNDNDLKLIIKKFKNIKNILLNKKIVLERKIIETGNTFSKSIFVTFLENEDLLNLRKNIIDKLLKSDYEFNETFFPHLSLIYKTFSEEKQKQNLIKKIKIPKMIEFNDLKLVLEEKPIENNDDILKWKFF